MGFRKNIQGEEIYANALSRIIVISSGEDSGSSVKIEDLIKELIKNKIVVDSFIINSNTKKQFNKLCALSKMTGGLSFHFNDLSEIIPILDNISFINYDEREKSIEPLIINDRKTIQTFLKPKDITESFIIQVSENVNFDNDVQNKYIKQAKLNVPLITPQCFISKKSITNSNSRIKRIMIEAQKAVERVKEGTLSYDTDMKIYFYKSNVDKWKVFLKSPTGAPYENQWFYLYVSFPDLYPYHPPVIRFVHPFFHINVGSDGKICIPIIDNDYQISMHVVDILQEIKELLLLPYPEVCMKLDLYNLYINDNLKYIETAKKNSLKFGKKDYRDYLQSSFIEGFS